MRHGHQPRGDIGRFELEQALGHLDGPFAVADGFIARRRQAEYQPSEDLGFVGKHPGGAFADLEGSPMLRHLGQKQNQFEPGIDEVGIDVDRSFVGGDGIVDLAGVAEIPGTLQRLGGVWIGR